jgi:hypothetical protein
MPNFLEGQEPFELPPNIIQPCVGVGRGYLSFLWLFKEKTVMETGWRMQRSLSKDSHLGKDVTRNDPFLFIP